HSWLCRSRGRRSWQERAGFAHVGSRSEEPAVILHPPPPPVCVAHGGAHGGAVADAWKVGVVAAPAVAPDRLARMVVRAAETSVLVEISDDGIIDAEVEAQVEDRLVPAEMRAVADRRLLVSVEPL